MADQPQEIEMQEKLVKETITATVVVDEQKIEIQPPEDETRWAQPTALQLIDDEDDKVEEVASPPQVVPVITNNIINVKPYAKDLSVEETILNLKMFYITKYVMERCDKYERVGNYERINSATGIPLYGIVPVDENTVSSLAISPILFITKNEDRSYEVDKKYHRKFWCMFNEGVRVTDEPCYLVLDGMTKKEIMRVKRVSEVISKKKIDKKNVIVEYRYTFEIGDLKLIFKPILKEKRSRTPVIYETTTTDDLGNTSTSVGIDSSTPFGIYRGDELLYSNFTERDEIQKENNIDCCVCCNCGGSNDDEIKIETVNTCCCCCCNCRGGGGSYYSGGSAPGLSAEGMPGAWINVGDNVGTCCKPPRGRTNTFTKKKSRILGSNGQSVLFITTHSRMEAKMCQEFFSNSSLVEMEKYAASFEEIIALIFSQLNSILSVDQYDIDKDLPEKPPCPCID